MINDAIKSIRGLVAAAFAVQLVWLLTLSEASQAFKDYETMLDLSTYLHLKEFTNSLPLEFDETEVRRLEEPDISLGCTEKTPYFRDRRPGEGVGYRPGCPYIEIMYPDKTKWKGARWEPLKLTLFFPIERYSNIRLYRHDGGSVFIKDYEEQIFLEGTNDIAEFFDIESDDKYLRTSNYEIYHFASGTDERYGVIPREQGHRVCCLPGTNKPFLTVSNRDRPVLRERIRLLLLKNGITDEIDGLKVNDSKVLKLYESLRISSRRISMLGFSIPIVYAMPGCGFLLAVIALQMLGPLRRLRMAEFENEASDWVFLYPKTKDIHSIVFQTVLKLISTLFVLSPLIIVVLAFNYQIYDLAPTWLVWVNSIGALLASYVFRLVQNGLEKHRVKV